jgi:hypothetical protein
MIPNLISKVRNLIDDNLVHRSYDRSFISSKIFLLEDNNVVSASIVIEKNGEIWDADNYSYDEDTNKITIAEETGEDLEVGDSLRFNFDCYEKYSDAEIERQIKNALVYLSVEKYETFDLETGDTLNPEPTSLQENLIAMVAAILIKGTIRSYRTPEFTITFGDNLTVDEKISQLITKFSKTYGSYVYIDPTDDPALEETGD